MDDATYQQQQEHQQQEQLEGVEQQHLQQSLQEGQQLQYPVAMQQQQQQQEQPTSLQQQQQLDTVQQQQQDLQEQQAMQVDQQDPQQLLLQGQADYQAQVQQMEPYQQQQQVWYQLDARGKIDNYDEEDWFVPEVVPFKRRQNVSSTMAASRPHPWKRIRHHIAAENYSELPVDVPTYVSLEAPPPLYPPKRYCDITGCEAPYVDPKTHLRYANTEAFKIARSLTDDEVQTRLGIRNAQSVLK